jgi:hypothetical protein
MVIEVFEDQCRLETGIDDNRIGTPGDMEDVGVLGERLRFDSDD